MLVAAGFRDAIWPLLRLPGEVDSPGRFAAVALGGAVVGWLAGLAVRRGGRAAATAPRSG